LTGSRVGRALLLGIVACLSDACCGTEDEARVASPDRKHTAYSYLRNCGATTDYVTVVELMGPGDSRGSVVYQVEGGAPIQLKWASSDHLLIQCVNCPPRHPAAPPVDGVTITVVHIDAITAPPNDALKRTKRPRGATVARKVAPRAHSRTGRFAA